MKTLRAHRRPFSLPRRSFRLPHFERGMSLIELMVGMLIGLIGIVIITHLYVTNEQYKRSTTGSGAAQVNYASRWRQSISVAHLAQALAMRSGAADVPPLPATPAFSRFAAAQRTFVASYGLDANPCTLVAPCRTLQRGADVADAGGEVVVLDSAGYGPLTITKSLSVITPEGIYAGITLTGAFGALVNPGEGGRVVLRGLSIVGAGGLYGIWVSSGRELRIERCEVSGMVQDGININGGSAVHIAGSLLRAIGASGIHVSSGSADVYVTDTRLAWSNLANRPMTASLLGQFDLAAIIERDYIGWIWSPDLKAFRQSPEFKALAQERGLLSYWREQGFPPFCQARGAEDFECE